MKKLLKQKDTSAVTNCFICDALVPDIDGPISEQDYLPQSPGCWKLYTDVLAREYGEWKYPDIHRMTVDCYAAQHPTMQPNSKSAQSVTVHLIAIYFSLKKDMPAEAITKKMGEIVSLHKNDFEWFDPPLSLGEVTISDVRRAQNLEEHINLVQNWGESVWQAWSYYHSKIIDLATV